MLFEEIQNNPTIRFVAQSLLLASILAQTWVAITVIVSLMGFFMDPR